MEKSINFFSEPFNYLIRYCNYDNSPLLYIELVHNKSFLTWYTTLNTEILGKHQNSVPLIDTLTPEIVFDIFSSYKNNTQKKDVEVFLPEGYKTETDEISIKISFIAFTYGDKKIEDPRIICLTAKKLDYEYRMDKKIETVSNKLCDKIDEIKAEMAELRSMIDKLQQLQPTNDK